MAKIVTRQEVELIYVCSICHWQPLTPFKVDLGWHCPNDGTLLSVLEKPKKSEAVCEACHYPVWIGSRFCVHCGEKLEEEVNHG